MFCRFLHDKIDNYINLEINIILLKYYNKLVQINEKTPHYYR